MVYLFETGADAISTKTIVSLPLPAKLSILNLAQLTVVKNKQTGKGTGVGFEESGLRSDELQRIHVPEYHLKKVRLADTREQIFEADITELRDQLYMITRMHAWAVSKFCQNKRAKIRISIKDAQTDDLELLRMNANIKPSLPWRRGLSRRANDKIQIYADGYEIQEVVIDYLRYPVQMDMLGYQHFDGTPGADVQCEFSYSVQQEIINEAIVNVRSYMGDPAVKIATEQALRSVTG